MARGVGRDYECCLLGAVLGICDGCHILGSNSCKAAIVLLICVAFLFYHQALLSTDVRSNINFATPETTELLKDTASTEMVHCVTARQPLRIMCIHTACILRCLDEALAEPQVARYAKENSFLNPVLCWGIRRYATLLLTSTKILLCEGRR